MNSKIKAYLEHPQYFITSPASKGYLDWVPDAIYLKILYRVISHRKLHLKHPKHYNEKLQWMKLNDRKPEYSRMVDKYEVRGYIAELLGEEYLIPCLGVYDSFEDIDFDKLPDRFVIKCTHDSGSVVICRDKSNFDIEAAKNRIQYGMKRNYYSTYREWPYKNVKPRIIIEEYMDGDDDGDLKDYKVMCFGGRAEMIQTHENRFIEGKVHTQTFYDRDWNILDLKQFGFEPVDVPSKRPALMDEVLRLAEIVSKDMYHARIDWYIVGDRIYFGEITFYDGSGFYPFVTEEMEEYMGSLIKLPID